MLSVPELGLGFLAAALAGAFLAANFTTAVLDGFEAFFVERDGALDLEEEGRNFFAGF